MSTTLDGTGIFTNNAENQGIVNIATFDTNASNSGIVTTNAQFSGNAANHGQVGDTAVFTGSAINTGTIHIGAFYDHSTNAGIVTISAYFANASTNSNTVSGAALFANNAANNGGTVGGNAVFADTTTNNGLVMGDAQFAATAVNNGSVGGTASYALTGIVYDQASNTWFDYLTGGTTPINVNGKIYFDNNTTTWYQLQAGQDEAVDINDTHQYDNTTNRWYYHESSGRTDSTGSIVAVGGVWYERKENNSTLVLANGAYNTIYLVQGQPTESTVPRKAQNGTWYTYSGNEDGETVLPTLAQDAAYSTVYLQGGLATASTLPLKAEDNIWYTYAGDENGTSILPDTAQGAYSNGYFISGVPNTSTLPLKATDNNNWYTYAVDGDQMPEAFAATEGVYSTAYLTDDDEDGIVVATASNAPRKAEDNNWYTYEGDENGTSSLPTQVTDGAYSTVYLDEGTATASTAPRKAEDNAWYTYSGGEDGVDVLPTPAATAGAYSTVYLTDTDGNGTLEATASTAPRLSELDGYWYTYTGSENGTSVLPTLATPGAYSTAYLIDNNTPTASILPLKAEDNNWYTYAGNENSTNVLPTPASIGTYSTAYLTDPDGDGIVVATASTAPRKAEDNNWYTYTGNEDGSTTATQVTDGVYSTVYLQGGVATSSTLPRKAQDTNNWYTYTGSEDGNATATPATDGAYSTVYLTDDDEDGIVVATASTLPRKAEDNNWYTYTGSEDGSTTATPAQDGVYSTVYLTDTDGDGIVVATASTLPRKAENNYWYTYTGNEDGNATATPAQDGVYSTAYLTYNTDNETIEATASTVPLKAEDGNWYVYTGNEDGNATATPAQDGVYSTVYLQSSVATASTLPRKAENNYWYTYSGAEDTSTISPTPATEGVYSTAYLTDDDEDGIVVATASTAPRKAEDNNWYTYTGSEDGNATATLAIAGTYSTVYLTDDDGDGIVVATASTAPRKAEDNYWYTYTGSEDGSTTATPTQVTEGAYSTVYLQGGVATASTLPRKAEDNNWYTYTGNEDGITTATPAQDGVYSTVYLQGGVATSSTLPRKAQDTNNWYTYTGSEDGNATATLAIAGTYSTVYLTDDDGDGIVVATASTAPRKAEDNYWYTYTGNEDGSTTATQVTDGTYSTVYLVGNTATPSTLPRKAEDNAWYTYTGSEDGITLPTLAIAGAYSTVYLSDIGGGILGATASTAPRKAEDNNWYTYTGNEDGSTTATLAGVGAYSTAYLSDTNMDGILEAIASTTPRKAQDTNNWYTYTGNEDGSTNATQASIGTYSTVYLTTNSYGTFEATASTLPRKAEDNNNWYTYTGSEDGNATATLAIAGTYSTAYLTDTDGDGVVVATASTAPRKAEDNNWYTYTGNEDGSTTATQVTDGVYSTVYLQGGVATASTAPRKAQDTNNWYTYTGSEDGNATATPATDGAYSTVYLNGGLATASTAPRKAQDTNTWYTYTGSEDGITLPTLATAGAYSTAYLSDIGNGILGATTSTDPRKAQDTNNWYTYTGNEDGYNTLPSPATTGAYSTALLSDPDVDGIVEATANPTPLQVNGEYFYTFTGMEDGVNVFAPLANGPYSTGAYLNGVFDDTFSGTHIAIDNGIEYYYNSGMPNPI